MAQLVYGRVELKKLKLTRREQLIMLEIGNDRIDSASSFVDYMNENYGFSKSSMWYCLNRMREHGIAQFANKGEQGMPLYLTDSGLSELGKFINERNEIIREFSNSFLKRMQDKQTNGMRYGRQQYDRFTLYSRLG